MVLNQILEPLLRPLLDSVGPFWTVFIVSITVSTLTTLVYKFTTDQHHLRSLKADLKRYQKKLSAQKNNPEKALKIQKDLMKVNGEYMKHSLRSSLYTFLPIILFFGWLSANLAYAPLLPGEPFTVNVSLPAGVTDAATINLPDGITTTDNLTQKPNERTVSWTLSGDVGHYDASIQIGEEEQFFSFIISDKISYVNPLTTFDSSTYFSSIQLSNQKLLIFENVPLLKSIPWISSFGWFGAYFLFSIIFSTSLRKALNLA
ncbi:MAG: DUF106 domain-containing protein [Nanoarchaeota archaeon]|nr:DUF106 domain-containing protein [Nanoarchaeota archaeon]